jgi:hypothetical protein
MGGLSANTIWIIVLSAVTVAFAAGVGVCFGLFDAAKMESPEVLCYMEFASGCTDKLENDEIYATFLISVKIAECNTSETVEMWIWGNCANANATLQPPTYVRYGGSGFDGMSYAIGANTCQTRPNDSCAWDHGDFKFNTETLYISLGVVFATLGVITLITVLMLLCISRCPLYAYRS